MAAEESDSQMITGPILGRPEDFPERPRRERSGGRFLAYAAIGAIVIALSAGWGYVMVLGRGNPDVRGQLISFDLGDPHALPMTLQVSKPADRTAVCRLRAVDASGAEVGSREIEIAAGEDNVTLTQRLETSAPAANGQIQYCYLVQ
ncbi:DUF4307 domain-containing protein [Thermopolyspora sp. NPDC052614]|uniref:DUF4307 domain-containing protein n=1 Tax=Thermopolyspora sp. NPDC052614 TaxID=3155682 RepID=UPI003438A90D